jgi:fructokinase
MTGDHERHTGSRETPAQIAAAAAGGDVAANRTLRRYEDRMARALASIVNVLDPDVIVLGGGMSNIEQLYRSVPQLWTRHVFGCGAESANPRGLAPQAQRAHERVRTRLVRATHGDSSGVRGAAWLWRLE